ncbi:cation-translocating P-type ATPase [Schleiferilactobacillus shenzhenensis]|uniref:cation-translocating P-type ATPase n=1 Tax=Schleiferilactobacillus shenzhenensis TaxID=1231337 RepID=UPI000691CEBB
MPEQSSASTEPKAKQDDLAFLTPGEVFDRLDSKPQGLTSDQASQRQEQYGKNQIETKEGEPMWVKFLKNFISTMAILLWIGGAVAFFSGTPELGIAIWLVNVINGLFSFFQESKASKATDALKKMLPTYARVIRDGTEQQVNAVDLVPGDVMLVEEGDKISADARLLEMTDLQVNQSALTGESNPVRKSPDQIVDHDLSRFELKNMIFAGTTVSSGNGKAVVSAIAMDTEFGKIANLTQGMKEEKSPLEKELDKLTQQISFIAVTIGVIFFIGAAFFVRQPLAAAFIFSLGMIVAFIPEGLLPTVTLSLAMAVQRMAKEHALMKSLNSVETLGSTSVICSDKTGTLTQNEMTVNHVWLPEGEFIVHGQGYSPDGSVTKDDQTVTFRDNKELELTLSAATLCSNARILPPDDEHPRYTVLGDPTEACLGVAAEKAKIDIKQLLQDNPRLRELPFDSNRKRMTVINNLKTAIDGNKRVAFVKGAPKETSELCTTTRENGKIRPLTDEDRKNIMAANDQYARSGLRVLAVAYRPLDHNDSLPKSMTKYTPELIEQDMVFLGLVVMADPPRVEVAAAVEKCNEANIRIIMITGDYGLTAESIAKRIGIVKGDNPRVVTGFELGKMSDDDLKKALSDEVIFARVAPEQKYRVVTNLQEMGKVVAVTGDGVNDAPALKKADIGVAMGITGTDVAKEAADMILTDDNFASIVHAVEEGRAVFDNIRKFLVYIFNSNMSEGVPSAFFLFSKGLIALPLTVMQILSIDLGTDMLPALGLGTEEPEEGIMHRPPRKHGESLLTKGIVVKAFFWYGLLEAILAMVGYFYANWNHTGFMGPLASSGLIYRQATTMTLGAIIFTQIGNAMNCRTNKQSIFKAGLFKNKLVNIGIVFEICLFAVLSYAPFMHGLFNTAPLAPTDWIYLVCCPFIVVAIEETRKAWLRHRDAKRGNIEGEQAA